MACLVDNLYGRVLRRSVSLRLPLSSSSRRSALPWRSWVRRASVVEGFPVGSRGAPLRCRSARWRVRTWHHKPPAPGVNRAGTEPDEGVTALNLVTGETQFVTVNDKPAQNFMGIGLAYNHDGT